MTKTQKLFFAYIEAEIEELVEGLKPEIKQKAIFSSIRDGDLRAGAKCDYSVSPPLIQFQINALEETFRPQIIKSLGLLLNHEIIHSLGEIREKEVYQKQDKVNFNNGSSF